MKDIKLEQPVMISNRFFCRFSVARHGQKEACPRLANAITEDGIRICGDHAVLEQRDNRKVRFDPLN